MKHRDRDESALKLVRRVSSENLQILKGDVLRNVPAEELALRRALNGHPGLEPHGILLQSIG